MGEKIVKEKGRNSGNGNLNCHHDSKDELEEPAPIPNPYVTRKGKGKQAAADDRRSSLTSDVETIKGNSRQLKKNKIRITMAFTPRTIGTGDFRRVAQEISKYTQDFNYATLLLLPCWDKNSELGRISLKDLENPHALHNVIKYYFDKRPCANWQLGVPMYGIGIWMSANMDKYEFINRCNIQKREYTEMKKVVLTINLASMQKSSNKNYNIGIAVGSTENQDYEILNKKLEEERGIKGIEISFQNVNQSGISQDFGKMANIKANNTNKDKFSWDHLQTKYAWAPNALKIYVPNKEAVTTAQKTMIQKYGKLDNGVNPVWSDGSSM